MSAEHAKIWSNPSTLLSAVTGKATYPGIPFQFFAFFVIFRGYLPFLGLASSRGRHKLRWGNVKMKNLLLISQDSEVVDLVGRVAGRSGVDLVNPETTAEATQVIREEPPRINMIVLDLVPRAQRLALLEQIRGWRESVPVIALTDVEDQIAGSIACAKGADEALQKPLSEHLVEKIFKRL